MDRRRVRSRATHACTTTVGARRVRALRAGAADDAPEGHRQAGGRSTSRRAHIALHAGSRSAGVRHPRGARDPRAAMVMEPSRSAEAHKARTTADAAGCEGLNTRQPRSGSGQQRTRTPARWFRCDLQDRRCIRSRDSGPGSLTAQRSAGTSERHRSASAAPMASPTVHRGDEVREMSGDREVGLRSLPAGTSTGA